MAGSTKILLSWMFLDTQEDIADKVAKRNFKDCVFTNLFKQKKYLLYIYIKCFIQRIILLQRSS